MFRTDHNNLGVVEHWCSHCLFVMGRICARGTFEGISSTCHVLCLRVNRPDVLVLIDGIIAHA